MEQIYPKQTMDKTNPNEKGWVNISYYDLFLLDRYKNFKFGENIFASPEEDELGQT